MKLKIISMKKFLLVLALLFSLASFSQSPVDKSFPPENYIEGPFMLKHNGKYYFMWSEGDWTGTDYCVAYAIADSPFGPFKRVGKILEQDTKIANGAGHHSIIKGPGKDEWYIVYHRRPLGETDGNYLPLHSHDICCLLQNRNNISHFPQKVSRQKE
jgi:beta-xylosidase